MQPLCQSYENNNDNQKMKGINFMEKLKSVSKDKGIVRMRYIFALVLTMMVTLMVYDKNRQYDLESKALKELQQEEDIWVSKETVYAYNWCEKYENYPVCTAEIFKGSKGINYDWYYRSTTFLSPEDVDEITSENDDYIGDFDFIYKNKITAAKLFFDGKSCYALCYNRERNSHGERNRYEVVCCNGVVEGGLCKNIFFPCPVYTVIDYDRVDLNVKKGIEENIVDELYENCSFEEACEFYEKLNGKYFVIDRDSQTITVDGYHPQSDGILDKYITLDFKNKIYVYNDIETKEHIVFDGYPKKENRFF